MGNSIYNFYKCVENHPEFLHNGVLFIGYSSNYRNLVSTICAKFSKINSQLKLISKELKIDDLGQIKEVLSQANLFILFYDSDYTQALGRPVIIQHILEELKLYWPKSCVLKDYGEYFKEAFGVCPIQQQELNKELISLAMTSERLTYYDDIGSELEVDIKEAKWTSICGCGNYDLVPGEIATIGRVNGEVQFVGAFLSVVPFAAKYGFINEPLTLIIENNIIVNVKSSNTKLVKDFNKYIQYNSSNATVEEVGIGTNQSVQLHGINAGFEERHVGLHLGLGGAKPKSDHLDLIFQNGSLLFDNHQIIRNEIITFKA